MGSREEILSRIAKVKPTGNELPEDLSFISGTGNLLESFVQTARNNGSQVTFVENTDGVLAYLRENIASDKRIISNINALKEDLYSDSDEITDPHELENVEVALIEGSIGWITEKQMKYRALPFITQHLFVILAADKIVALMHDAYKIIEIEGGFSSFISGPSKTADIEQSLVIGAHGARSHHIFIMNNQ